MTDKYWNKNFKIDKEYEKKFERLVKKFTKEYKGLVRVNDSFVFRQLIEKGERCINES